MKFDREAPGGGVEIYCGLQTGKAVLEWKFYCTPPGQGAIIKLYVWDDKNNLILEARQLSEEEELLKTIILHPRLWNSTKNPYLYRAEVILVENSSEQEDFSLDKISLKFPIRSFREIPGKGWLLNGEPFERKAVRYEKIRDIPQFLELLLAAGVNTLCVSEPHMQSPFFYQVCEEKGFVIWSAGTGEEVNGRDFWKNGRPSDLFYSCRASWSEEPFVYISRESLRRQENGNYSIIVYSNQKKVALYVNGILFEFQSGEREFFFREIPFRTLFLCLTAEAGECVMSLVLHKAFTKALE